MSESLREGGEPNADSCAEGPLPLSPRPMVLILSLIHICTWPDHNIKHGQPAFNASSICCQQCCHKDDHQYFDRLCHLYLYWPDVYKRQVPTLGTVLIRHIAARHAGKFPHIFRIKVTVMTRRADIMRPQRIYFSDSCHGRYKRRSNKMCIRDRV